VRKLLERAPRSIPLAADPGPLAVCWEDEALLAAAKPPGVRSAPVHRFEGHNMLGRMIHRLGYEPHLLHRCVSKCIRSCV
jgi:23S rRNA-/tRNA-specific pseudouridylate synthase